MKPKMSATYHPAADAATVLQARAGQRVEAVLLEPSRPGDEVYAIHFPDGYLAEGFPHELVDCVRPAP